MRLICAAPAGIVREILPRLPATRIPGVPDTVEGLVNVRGSLLTVLDGHLLLQQERRSSDEGAIVVLEVKGEAYGLGGRSGAGFPRSARRLGGGAAGAPWGRSHGWSRRSGWSRDRHFILLDVDAVFAPIIGGAKGGVL